MIKYLKELLEYLEYYNKMAPFPIYDTEYVELVKNKLQQMEKNKEQDYNLLPTASCKYCNSLSIQVDDLENDHCMRCGSINELVIHSSFYEYKKYVEDKMKMDGID